MPKKTLVDYFRLAAKIAGKASEQEIAEGRCLPDGQAYYSLYWYFKALFAQDIDKKNPECYNEVLDAFLGKQIESVCSPAPIGKADREREDRALDELFPQDAHGLNSEQRTAVHKALHYPLSIIQGPPGTGKTDTIVHIAALAVWLGMKVAVLSANRAAVDNVTQKVGEALKGAGQFPRAEKDLAYALATKYVPLGSKETRASAVDPVTGKGLGFDSGRHNFDRGGFSVGWEKEKRFDDFLSDYPFITCTMHSVKKCFKDGDKRKYDLVIVDEASQANLLGGIVAMSCAKRLVLVGDLNQLPPVFTAEAAQALLKAAQSHKLYEKIKGSAYDMSDDDVSILSACEKVFKQSLPTIKTLLTKHYRCHPAIIGFCNERVYEGKLKIRSKPENEDVPCPISILWYEGDYREGCWLHGGIPAEENPDKKVRSTFHNQKQLTIMQQEEMGRIFQLADAGKSICVLSPFRGQIYDIKHMLENLFEKHRSNITVDIERLEEGDEGPSDGGPVALTIHKSQGREYDVVYLLPVEDGNWEWPWSEGRRLVNVAVSRAKQELRLIVSTKLMSENAQERLCGYTVKVKHPARDQGMFVRQLVDYTLAYLDGLPPERKAAQQRYQDEFGVRKSAVVSIFDAIPQFDSNGKGSRKDSNPERCFEDALRKQSWRGVYAFARNVTFDRIIDSEGKPLNKRVAALYANASSAHFDFVIVKRDTREIFGAVEIDGAQHRFKKFKGKPDRAIEKRDYTKNQVAVNVCGAAPCLLQYSRSIIDTKPFDGADAGERIAWKTDPRDVGPASSFVYMRVPADGSTYYEFNSLRESVEEADCRRVFRPKPPTVNDFLNRMRDVRKASKGGASVYYLDESVKLIDCG